MFNIDEKLFCPPIHTHDHGHDQGHFPPHKPSYTMTEEMMHTAKEMRATIDRLLRFEERLKEQFEDMLKNITSDNVIFKNTFAESHRTFIEAVKNEINVFEGNVDSSVTLFKEDIESRYSGIADKVHADLNKALEDFTKTVETNYTKFSSDLAAYKTELNSTYDTFRNAIENRLEQHNSTHTQAFNDYVASVNTKLATMEAKFNSDYTSFVTETNKAITTFKTTWANSISARLDGQDSMINDAVLYMKTNLNANVQLLLDEMALNGDIEVLATAHYQALKNDLNYVTPEMYGAVGDGSADDSKAIADAIEYASTHNIRKVVFRGMYRVDNTITLSNYRQDKTHKPVELVCSDGLQYTNCIIGNTGKEVFRFENTHHMVTRLNIVSALYNSTQFVNPIPEGERVGSTVGMIITRATGEASTHTFDIGGTIYLHSDMSKNDGYGTVGVYNDTCEMVNYKDCWYVADTPIVITTRDILNLTSNPYTDSCKDHYFVGRNTLITHANACIVIDGAIGVHGTIYGNSELTSPDTSCLRVPSYVQNFDITIDTEYTGNVVDGKGCLSYGKLSLSSAGIQKGIYNVSLNSVDVYENLYFHASVTDKVVVDITDGENVMSCNIFTQYATADTPRKIINGYVMVNTNIYPANSATPKTVVVEKGGTAVMTLYNIYEGNVDGYARNVDNRMVGWSYAMPTADVATGSIFINRSDIMEAEVGHPAFWLKRGAEYIPMCQVGYRITEADSLSTFKPRFKGEFIVDTENKLHMATGTNAGDWTE